MNSTFKQSRAGSDSPIDPETSLIEQVSPPQFVTFRPGRGTTAFQADQNLDHNSFQNAIINMMENFFEKQEQQFNKLFMEFEKMRKSVDYLNGKYDEIIKKTDAAAAITVKLDARLTVVEEQQKIVTQLQNKIDTMEQHARQCNIEIGNLPERRGENLNQLMENLFGLIKQPINTRDIVAVHRVPHANPKNPHPKNIIVELSSRTLRDNLIAASKLCKGITSDRIDITGVSQRIYINEHLTLKNKTLFREARLAAKSSGHRFVWVRHGTILVRESETSPVFAVRSTEDLRKIKSRSATKS